MTDQPGRPREDDTDENGNPDLTVDGRRLRRERNVAAVIGAVIEMFEEQALTPTIERAAERSGLSLRSVYRYFPDPDSLIQAAIDEMKRRSAPVAHLSAIGCGPFDERVAQFAEMRVRLYELVGPAYRACRVNAPTSVQICDDLERTRRVLTEQFELQFAREIEALPNETRSVRSTTADVMSQLDAINTLRRTRRLSVAESIAVVDAAITLTLGPDSDLG